MQLVFRKKDGEEIATFIEKNGKITEFSYNEMIINIYKDRKVEEAKLDGGFTEVERESIAELIDELKEALRIFECESELDDLDDLDDIPF